MQYNSDMEQQVLHVLVLLHKAGYESAIIAGGAIRDAHGHKPIKDIDIFIHTPSISRDSAMYVTIGSLSRILELKPSDAIIQNPAPDNYADDPEHIIAELFDVGKNDIDFQLIFLTIPPIEYVNDWFDIGLCKAYYDGTRVHYTSDYVTDATNKTLTIVGKHLNTGPAIDERIKRLQLKYPEYVVKFAPHNDHICRDMIRLAVVDIEQRF